MRIARPGGCGDRVQALADVVAEQPRQLIYGEGAKAIVGLELARELAAEIALDERRAERPQMVAAGLGAIDGAEQPRLHRQIVRPIDAEKELVGQAERQRRGGLLL